MPCLENVHIPKCSQHFVMDDRNRTDEDSNVDDDDGDDDVGHDNVLFLSMASPKKADHGMRL